MPSEMRSSGARVWDAIVEEGEMRAESSHLAHAVEAAFAASDPSALLETQRGAPSATPPLQSHALQSHAPSHRPPPPPPPAALVRPQPSETSGVEGSGAAEAADAEAAAELQVADADAECTKAAVGASEAASETTEAEPPSDAPPASTTVRIDRDTSGRYQVRLKRTGSESHLLDEPARTLEPCEDGAADDGGLAGSEIAEGSGADEVDSPNKVASGVPAGGGKKRRNLANPFG